MSLNRLFGGPLIGVAFPRIIRIVVGNNPLNPLNNNNIHQNIAININNININNNNNEDPNDVSLLRLRARLFRVLFFKIAVIYALTVPARVRKVLEWSVLVMAFLSLFVLCHLHLSFIRTPINCLDHIQNDWPRDGILRVQILSDPHQSSDSAEEQRSATADTALDDQNPNEFLVNNSTIGLEFNVFTEAQVDNSVLNSADKELNTNYENDVNTEASDESQPSSDSVFYSNLSAIAVKDLIDYSNQINNNNENNGYPQPLNDKVSHLQMIARAVWPHDSYIIEYSLEYGFLRLSARSRHRLQIPIKVVTLDPTDNRCFGDVFSRTLLSNFLGYDDILMGSLKNLAEKENNRGYVRNVITGEHYRFVNVWMTRASYIAAAFIMLVFTLSISMLLRYSHHQVFVFVAQLMHTLESNVHLTYQTFPAAPLLTVILALVGMEAIMSEFFNDTTTAFYVILIVWLADQFDAMCSHTVLTRRHWLKFFYLYHFGFYAYDYRFNGQYSGLALLTSWLFTQHSMIYFFHSYELPHILSQTHPITIETTIRQPPEPEAPEPSDRPAGGGASGVETAPEGNDNTNNTSNESTTENNTNNTNEPTVSQLSDDSPVDSTGSTQLDSSERGSGVDSLSDKCQNQLNTNLLTNCYSNPLINDF